MQLRIAGLAKRNIDLIMAYIGYKHCSKANITYLISPICNNYVYKAA